MGVAEIKCLPVLIPIDCIRHRLLIIIQILVQAFNMFFFKSYIYIVVDNDRLAFGGVVTVSLLLV